MMALPDPLADAPGEIRSLRKEYGVSIRNSEGLVWNVSMNTAMTPIYLDYNATSPMDPTVLDAMLPWLGDQFGNPSSLHYAGQQARRAVDRAREQVAQLLNAPPECIVFTSGGTEANNLAIFGIAEGTSPRGRRLVCSAIEHHSVLETCRHATALDGNLDILPVDPNGQVRVDAATAILNSAVRLCSVMLANNDTGTLQPVESVSRICRSRDIILHSDAVQALGKMSVDFRQLGVHLLSVSAHKMGGPKGAGALVVAPDIPLVSRQQGGYQERRLRPGTENVAAIVGFGRACERTAEQLSNRQRHLRQLQIEFEALLCQNLAGVTINGGTAPRLPNTSNIRIHGIHGESLAINLDVLGIAVSTGSACSAILDEPSHVLLAMGQTPDQARASVRVSFGPKSTFDDVRRAVDGFAAAVKAMRNSGYP
jgi:cysteine desulfurase